MFALHQRWKDREKPLKSKIMQEREKKESRERKKVLCEKHPPAFQRECNVTGKSFASFFVQKSTDGGRGVKSPGKLQNDPGKMGATFSAVVVPILESGPSGTRGGRGRESGTSLERYFLLFLFTFRSLLCQTLCWCHFSDREGGVVLFLRAA